MQAFPPLLADSDLIMYTANLSTCRGMSCNIRSALAADNWEAICRGVKMVMMPVCPDAGINLAEAALQVAAEDDAIVSHSTVRLPIQSFLQRIDRLASNMRSAVLQRMPEDAMPDDILQVRRLTRRHHGHTSNPDTSSASQIYRIFSPTTVCVLLCDTG